MRIYEQFLKLARKLKKNWKVMVFLLNLQRNFNRIQTLTNHCNNIGYEDKALSDDGNPRSGHCYDEYDDDIVREGGQSHTSAQRYRGGAAARHSDCRMTMRLPPRM